MRNTDLAVVGLHTVFEHHLDAMTPVSKRPSFTNTASLSRLGVDIASEPGPIPKTMAV